MAGVGTVMFTAERTSDYGESSDPPCAGAVRGTRQSWDRRTFSSPEEYDKRFPGEPWLSRGTEHRYWSRGDESGIERRMDDEDCWRIEVASLDDLLALVEKEGKVVVRQDWYDPREWALEIYDTWRE